MDHNGSDWVGWGWPIRRALVFPALAIMLGIGGLKAPWLIIPSAFCALLYIAALGPKPQKK